jgi:predicted nucleic acid-binding protein
VLILATASAAGATALATNDRALRSTGAVEVVYLDQLSPTSREANG